MRSVTRGAVVLVASALSMSMPGAIAATPGFPQKPITIIVPYPAGGLTDVVTRTLSDSVARELGQPLVVESRPGAGGRIGMAAIKRAPRDGYTLGVSVPATLSTLPLTEVDVGYDPLKDFSFVTIAVDTIMVLLASPKVEAQDLKALTAFARANRGRMNYATPGNGTSFHLYSVMLNDLLGVEAEHVPYKGEVQILNDMVAGNIQYSLSGAGARPYIQSGRVRLLATTGAQRAPAFPDTPTLTELGVPLVTQGWVGYIAPAGVPEEVVMRLNRAFTVALKNPQAGKAITEMGYIARGSSPADFRASVAEALEKFGGLIRSGKVRMEK